MKHWWASSSGLIEFELDLETILECSHQGRCDEDVEYWQSKLDLNIDRQLMTRELKECGAWDIEELNSLDDSELEQKVLWIACCDLKEELYSRGEL